MSGLAVSAGERGTIRVFGLDADPGRVAVTDVARALGLASLNPVGVEIIALRDLSGVGLSGYLVEGLGVAPGAVTEADLAEVGPAAVLLRSAALSGPVDLRPRPPLRFIGMWRESDAPLPKTMPLVVDGLGPGVPADPAPGQTPVAVPARAWAVVAGLALAVLVVLLGARLIGAAS